jgi:hypothetical protein
MIDGELADPDHPRGVHSPLGGKTSEPTAQDRLPDESTIRTRARRVARGLRPRESEILPLPEAVPLAQNDSKSLVLVLTGRNGIMYFTLILAHQSQSST